MSIDSRAWLEKWNATVDARDLDGITAALADDVSMGAPPYWNELHDKEVVGRLLGVIVDTIEDFTYHRQWIDDNELALEFRGHVGDLGLHGIDLITLNEGGQIQHLDVMIRPANALMELMGIVGQKMQAILADLDE